MKKVKVGTIEFDLEEVKKQKVAKPKYYLCYIPKQPADKNSPFYDSWTSVRKMQGEDSENYDAYWAIFDKSQNGYSMADEKYPLKEVESEPGKNFVGQL